ncbi:SAM-dependent methyltransferase [Shewanella cyperi]|uniref:SAM-dependent methyltransferase n=1 Tax=Shewanella cyperi TaxID=2814292 RepID=A0A974XLV5_9GAMM|nr:SAM-dependent methyltransferase [Shewanella cyperi]QSX30786.1 SAM-dependent methyltransferase [Shewanella cyperi]
MTGLFRCPLCTLPLHAHQASGGWYCDGKHHFDKREPGFWGFAKPAKGKVQGDSRAELRAKHFLLESGILMPAITALAETVTGLAGTDGTLKALDFDCGDGYFSRALAATLPKTLALELQAVTEAENAAFAAAKAKGPAGISYASLKSLPYADGAFDMLWLMDKALKGKDGLRVLKQGGLLVNLAQGPRHLWQLRQYIYGDLSEKPFVANLPAGMTLVSERAVSFTLDLKPEAALVLLEMTPYAWRLKDAMRHQILRGDFSALELDYRIVVSQKA